MNIMYFNAKNEDMQRKIIKRNFKCKLSIYLIVLILLLNLSGCGKKYCTPVGPIEQENISSLTKDIKSDVYLDASGSMIGYTSNINSYYNRTLDILERGLISGWPKCNPKYYKFGTKLLNISTSDLFNAKYPNFYKDGQLSGLTHIETVFQKAKTENLTVIITDLFQSLADINKPLNAIKEKFLNDPEIGLGILGIKSEFNGVIYNINPLGKQFNYSTVGRHSPDYHPFYILILGKYADIYHLYQNMKFNGLSGFPEKNFLILSPKLVAKLTTFEDSNILTTIKLKEVTNLLDPRNTSEHFKQFVIQGNPEKASFTAEIKLHPLDSTIQIDPQKLIPVVSSWRYDQKSFFKCENSLKGIKINDVSIKNGVLHFRVDVSPSWFPGNGIYCFEIIVYPSQDAYALPVWISNWDMDQNLIDSDSQFKGNCTLNLKNFLNNIWQIIYQSNRPKIARLYFYLEKG